MVCTKYATRMLQTCNTHVAHLQQHMQKKSGGISAPAILFCSLSHFDNEHLFGLYRKWFTQCCCVVACPNNVKRCACDVFFLPWLQALAHCVIGTIVGCFSANNVSLYRWGIIGNAPLAHFFTTCQTLWHGWQCHCNRNRFCQNLCTVIGIELFDLRFGIALRLCNKFFFQCNNFGCIGFALFLCHFFSLSVKCEAVASTTKV